MKYTAIVDGEQIEIEFDKTTKDSLHVTLNGRKYELEARVVEPGVYWLNFNHRSLEAAVTPNGDGYIVSIAGKRIPVEIVDARAALRRAAHHAHAGIVEIRAPMPGKIVKVLAGEGAVVSANQGIVIMEAMKMQNEIKSPKKGIVKALRVNEGTAVNSGDLLATVE